METFASVLFLLAGSAWVGAIVFHSSVVAPAVFATLDDSGARLFLRDLFPKFFRFGLACGALIAAAVAALAISSSWSDGVLYLAVATALMIALEVISLRMVPAINAARDAGTSGEARFRRLHGASVLLTVVILLLGIGVLALFGMLASAELRA